MRNRRTRGVIRRDVNGTDGFLTSHQQLASGESIASLETFDQTTNQVAQTVASGSSSLFYTVGWGIWGNDTGLFCDQNASMSQTNCSLLNPVASGTLGLLWSPPFPSGLSLVQAAENTANVNATFLATSYSPYLQWQLVTSNLVNNTADSIYSINPPGAISAQYWGIAENTNTNTAVLPYQDWVRLWAPPSIVMVNLANGQNDAVHGIGHANATRHRGRLRQQQSRSADIW